MYFKSKRIVMTTTVGGAGIKHNIAVSKQSSIALPNICFKGCSSTLMIMNTRIMIMTIMKTDTDQLLKRLSVISNSSTKIIFIVFCDSVLTNSSHCHLLLLTLHVTKLPVRPIVAHTKHSGLEPQNWTHRPGLRPKSNTGRK